MTRSVHFLLLATLIGMAAGCVRPANQWAISEISPAGAPFPFSSVRLDPDGRYQAQGFFNENGDYTGRVQTIDGKYSWSGNKLALQPESGPTVTYKTRRRIDGNLVMTLDIPGQEKKIKAVMRPVPQPRIEAEDPKWTESSTSTSLPGSPPPKRSTASVP